MGELNRAKSARTTEGLLLREAGAGNVLPLTSACNVRCTFCSHHQNPPGVETYRISPRSLAEIEQALIFIDPARPVVIGESATRIIEGEPFSHPRSAEILSMVRSTFPGTTIQLTTNGTLLNRDMMIFLKKLDNVVIYLSLNSAGEVSRALLMGDVHPGRALRSVELLREYGVPFHGSLVAMPHLVGWDDIERTVKYLSAAGAETIRVFLPGFTDLAPPALRFEPSLWLELDAFISRLRRGLKTPVTCEPPILQRLEARVVGVIAGSPADRAGFSPGDVIESVDGEAVYTRVQAFNRILKRGVSNSVVKREIETLSLRLHKKPGERSGLVMDYDLDPSLIREMGRASRRYGASKVLVLTSELAKGVIGQGLQHFWREPAAVKAVAVKNHFFGGSIQAAGLLTVADFASAMEADIRRENTGEPDLVLLPGLAFDRRGRDLTGRSYLELEEMFRTNFEAL